MGIYLEYGRSHMVTPLNTAAANDSETYLGQWLPLAAVGVDLVKALLENTVSLW